MLFPCAPPGCGRGRFAAHGSAAEGVSPALGLAARDLLIAQHYRLEWREYPMAHSVCPEEIKAIGQWLNARRAALD